MCCKRAVGFLIYIVHAPVIYRSYLKSVINKLAMLNVPRETILYFHYVFCLPSPVPSFRPFARFHVRKQLCTPPHPPTGCGCVWARVSLCAPVHVLYGQSSVALVFNGVCAGQSRFIICSAQLSRCLLFNSEHCYFMSRTMANGVNVMLLEDFVHAHKNSQKPYSIHIYL